MMTEELVLTKEQKFEYLKMALLMQDIGFSDEKLSRVIATYERVLVEGEDFSIGDSIEINDLIEKESEKKYDVSHSALDFLQGMVNSNSEND